MKITNNNYLKKIEKQNTGASYLSRLPANNAGGLNVSAKPAAQSVVKNQPKDTWGAFGGALFVGEKLLTGLVSSFEGAVDYLGSGFAKLIGNDKWAEEIISEDWFGDWYSHPEEWFNPSEGWKIAGDVAGSIGTSIPALGIGIVTHGAALPTFAAAALPAAGRSTQEAYKKTGELGVQEFGYGAISGTVEGGLETVTNLIGMGTGTLIKSFSKSFAKEAGEAAVKEGLIKTVGKSFIGEAFEEGASEFLDPYIKRATYDGQAENATPDQIIYSGIIGGLSGAVMGGGGYGINTANSFIKGHKLTVKGGESEVFQTSDYILGKAQKDALDADIFKEIKETREKLTLSLESTGGKVETVAQKKMLGDLSRSNIVGAMNMGVARRALNIVNNAPDIAKRLSAYGYKDTSGRAMTFTAEEITAGYDPKKPSSIYKALKENAQLRSLAVADAAGALMLDTSRFAHATMTGEVLAGKVDLNRFRETATPEEIKAVSEALKIDSWQGLTYESFAEKLTDYLQGGGVNRAIKTNELKASFKTAEPSQAFSDIPKGVFFNNDGVRRYTDGNIDIGISKEGDSYRIYDYHTDSLTNEMSKGDVNGILRSYNGEKLKVFEAARAQKAAIEEMQKRAAEIDTYARDNIKDYKKLSSPAQSQIRRIIEDGRAKGVSDSDVLAYAKVAAHSGLDIVFDKESTRLSHNSDGKQYAIVALDNGNTYVTATRKVIKSKTLQGQRKEISHFFDVLLDGQPSLDIHTLEGDVLTITKAETADKARDNYKTVKNQRIKLSDDEFRVKLNAESHIDELAEISKSKNKKASDTKNHPFAKDGFTYRTAYFEDYDGKYYQITLSIGHNGTVATVYNVGEITKSAPSSAKIIAVTGSKALDETLSGNIIYQKGGKVNTNSEKNNAIGENSEYADGYYDASRNLVVINPEATRTHERLLIHELDHAIRKSLGKNGATRVYFEAIKNVDQKTRERIVEKYKKAAKPGESVATIMDETNAYYAEQVLGNKYTLEKLIEAEPTLKEKILNFFKGASEDYADVPKLSGAAKRYYRTYKKLFDEFSARNAENNAMEPFTNKNGSNVNENGVSNNVRTINGNNMSVSDRQYAVGTENKTRITAEMSDSERASVLRNRTLTAPIYKGQADSVIEDVKRNYEREKKAFGKKAVVEIAEKLGIIHESINFKDVDVKIELSNRNLKESITKEATPEQVAKLLPILSETAKSAVAIERHDNRYYHDSDTVYFDNLVGAYIDGENVIPVRFGLKYSRTGKTTLYVVVDQNKIPIKNLTEIKKTEVIATNGPDKSATEDHLNSVTYSISQILSFVNSKDLLRYIPDGFLDPTRIEAKKKAIAETQEYTDEKNDKKYSDFVKQGNLRAAKDMLAAKAKDVGHSDVNAEGKSKDITYDDDGKLIPISKRYDRSNPDRQYALPLDEDGNIPASEVLSWFENKPKGDGKIDLEATVARGLPYRRGKSDLTVGELRKVIANSTHEKVYSKKDALRVVNKFSGSSGLTVKAREEIADTIWQFLNEAPDIEYRADMAQDIAEFIVAKILVDSKTENPDAIAAAETLSYLRTGIGKISFTDGDITELHHAVDDKGVKRLVGRWGYKGAHKVAGGEMVSSRRVPMDVYVTEIAREMPGMEHLEEMHPVEAFLEIDRAYERAYADSKDKWISSYWDMPDSEIPSMIAGVRDAILEAYSSEGEKSKFSRLVDEKISRYQKRAEYFKAERDEIKGRDRILGLLMNEATKMKNLKLGTFANATQHESDVLRGSVERLARIQFRGNLNVSGTRDIIAELRLWYNQKNSMLGYKDQQNPGYYVQGVSDMLDALADGEGGFTKADLLMLRDVMAYFNNFVENFGKVYRKGRWVDAEPEAKRYVKTLQENTELKVGILRRALGSRYMQTFGDPMTVARRMDMYESGFYTEMMEELREGAIGAQVAEMEVREEYDRFLNENRKYIEKAGAEEVVYHGAKIPRLHLIGLYMTLKRKHSRAGLAENGFAFDNLKGERVRVNGFALDTKDITETEIDKRAEEQLDIIGRLLTDTDREYIKILEKAYNVDARKLKADRDMQRLGFTNAGMGYYYPIRRGNIAKNVDSSEYMAEMDRVSNSSFNKNTVRGARQEIFLENADIVFRRHVRAVCQYSYLAPAIEAYNTLYNMDVSGNPNQPISVATEGANVWDMGNKYFVKLISDIQGIPAVSGEGSEILARIRGGYAKFQLGANPKVWFTQGSSLFASTSLIDADSLIKGATISAKGMDKYCSLAKLRNSENTAAIAQAVLDTRAKKAGNAIDRVSDALMAPIGKMDRFVVSRLFGAAQAQVEKNGGGKVGTEENKIAAGKLLEKVLLETQQNSIATERSAAMRSGNEILRTVTMFTADSMKVVGRAIDGFGEVLTLRERIRRADGDAKAELENRLKSAEKKTRKALGALVTSAIYMACVAQLFRWLYDKEDDDKSTLEVMTADVAGNLIGGLPLVSDVISRLFLGGYELDNYAYSTFNDLVDSASKLIEVFNGTLTGEMGAEERNRALRDTAYAVGQLTGLPFRNVYNALFGLTKRFSPTVAFQVDSVFYEKNYQTELNRAIESGDNEMSSFILSLMLGERVSGDIPGGVFNEILALTKNGQKVLPRVMPDKVTIGGVEYTLTEGEREAMREIYSGADSALERLFANSGYKALDNSARAELIDHVYDSYYALASSSVLGTNGGNRARVVKAVGADTLALLYAKTKNIESDKDREGKTIAGSKRAKVVKAIGELGVSAEERLLLVCASGYTLKDGDIRGLSAEAAKRRLLKYILSLKGASAAEKAEIAEMCGFEVKNGKIVRSSVGNLPKLKI